MNVAEVAEVVREARAAGTIPDLSCANLPRADLAGMDMAGANVFGTDLTGAFLTGANLKGAYLAYANLFGANVFGANLVGANLTRVDLSGADLPRVDLSGADLTGANLTGTNLAGANLSRVRGGILAIDGLHPYRCLHIPTPSGWVTQVGCWYGTIPELRALIAREEGWPEAVGDEISRRRPLLEAFCAMAEAHESAHPDLIADLADYWKDQDL